MSKINVRILIKNKEEEKSFETTAILQEDILKYQEEDNTVAIFNYKENSLLRENKDLRMNYRYRQHYETEGEIEIKEYNKKINCKVKTEKLERKDNDIEIEFFVEGNPFLYRIEEIK